MLLCVSARTGFFEINISRFHSQIHSPADGTPDSTDAPAPKNIENFVSIFCLIDLTNSSNSNT